MARKISIVTGFAATIVCLGGMTTANSAQAMGCLNRDVPQWSLTRDIHPDRQHDYDKIAQLGNRCKAPEAANSVTQPTVIQPQQRATTKARSPKY